MDWEALEHYGLIQTSDRAEDLISAGILTILVIAVVGLYFRWRRNNLNYSFKAVFLIAITFLVFLAVGRSVIIDRTIMPYIYPLAAFALTLSTIFGFELAALLSTILGIMTAYGMAQGYDLTIFYVIPTIVGILVLGKAHRIASFFIAGITIGLSGIAIILPTACQTRLPTGLESQHFLLQPSSTESLLPGSPYSYNISSRTSSGQRQPSSC